MESETISVEMFNEFVQVAELELTPEESKSIREKMNEQLRVIHELESIPLDEQLAPVIHGNPYPRDIQAPLREDIWKPFENTQGIIDQAPRSQDGYIVSPDVPHQKLG
ncbi:MAG: hypothetical protein GYA26_09995 [Flexilinea flocculi]|jgi:aspartyl/glutamyl-tRNA(Asn/Gln) amidotransferase C subunit|nr:hypothetical protein [Flexilinea flocculi]